MAYATLSDYEAVYGPGAEDTASVEGALDAVSDYIDNITQRRFVREAEETQRVFQSYPYEGGMVASTDDMSEEPSAVEAWNGSAWEAITGTYSTPFDAPTRNEPYLSLHKDCYTAPARIRVTARWGWPEVPADIKRATIELAAIVLVEGPRATNVQTVVDSGFNAERALQPSVNRLLFDMLMSYRRLI